MVTIGKWTSFTNTHALQQNAGQPGHLYPDWTPFTPTEIKNFLALYILPDLSPLPRVKMKFSPHHEDPINGNDLVFKVFGLKGVRWHKHFKALFTVQNPLVCPPPRDRSPN